MEWSESADPMFGRINAPPTVVSEDATMTRAHEWDMDIWIFRLF